MQENDPFYCDHCHRQIRQEYPKRQGAYQLIVTKEEGNEVEV